MKTVIDVRENPNCDIQVIHDNSGDYLFEEDGLIGLYSKENPSADIYLCEKTKEKVRNFLLAIKVASGITENLGL